MSHTIVALVRNRPGVLHRVVTLLRRRGFNIESLTVAPSETRGLSRMTLVVDAPTVLQVLNQFNRLVEVVHVNNAAHTPSVVRETALLKVEHAASNFAAISAVITRFSARVAETGVGFLVLEVTATPATVDAFLEAMSPFGVLEVIRSGRIALAYGTAPASAEATGWAANDDASEWWLSQADGAR